MVGTTAHPSDRRQFEVGVSVSFRLGGTPLEGLIVEDRGPLASGGRHLYRILVSNPPEAMTSFEMPEEELAPQEPKGAILTEFARHAVQKWLRLPVGGPLDPVYSPQSLESVVVDACREVEKRVRAEALKLAGSLGMNADGFSHPNEPATLSSQRYAFRLSAHVRQRGLRGMHSELVKALQDSAMGERDRLLHLAEESGWTELVEALQAPPDRTKFPLLTLCANSSRR